MKHIFAIIISICLLITLAACDADSSSDVTDNDASIGTKTSANTTVADTTAAPEAAAYDVTYNNIRLYESSIDTKWMQAIVEITNTGTTDLFCSSGKFDIEDSTGKLVASKDYISVYPQIISEGEKAYYIVETTVDDTFDIKATYKVVPTLDVKASKVKKSNLTVTEDAIKADTIGAKITGRVVNDSTADVSDTIYVAAILFDADNKPIGYLSDTLTDKMVAGGKIGFEASNIMLPRDITVDKIASYKITAYTYQYQF